MAVAKAESHMPHPEWAVGGSQAEEWERPTELHSLQGLLKMMLAFNVPKQRDRQAHPFNKIKDNYYWLEKKRMLIFFN